MYKDRWALKLLVILFLVLLFSLAIWNVAEPDTDISVSERRKMRRFPEMGIDNILNGAFMEGLDAYAPDQFPFRVPFRTLKAVTSRSLFGQLDNNHIFLQDGHLFKMDYPMDPNSVDALADTIRKAGQKYFPDNQVYLAVVPDKNYYLPSGRHLKYNYDGLLFRFRDSLPAYGYIDFWDQLALSDYYLTDTHWRQEKLIPIANALFAGMGNPVVLQEADFRQESYTPFYGVYYGQSALPVAPDTLSWLDGGFLEGVTVTKAEYGMENQTMPLYDTAKLTGMDAYELFLDGPVAVVYLENNAAVTDQELVVFRDSFGSSLAPLLTVGYKSITLVDLRYITPQILEDYVDFHDKDILILYSTTMINDSGSIKDTL